MPDNIDVKFEMLLKTDTTSSGQKIKYPLATDPEITMMKVTLPSGESTGWHLHRFPAFAYVLKGVLTVELSSGEILTYSENDAISEVINQSHNGINNGSDDVVLIAFFMGEKGMALSEHEDD